MPPTVLTPMISASKFTKKVRMQVNMEVLTNLLEQNGTKKRYKSCWRPGVKMVTFRFSVTHGFHPLCLIAFLPPHSFLHFNCLDLFFLLLLFFLFFWEGGLYGGTEIFTMAYQPNDQFTND